MKLRLPLMILVALLATKSFCQQAVQANYQEQLNKIQQDLLFGNYADVIDQCHHLLLTADPKNKAYLYNLLSRATYKKVNYQKAQEYAEKALKISREKLSRNPSQEAKALDNLGNIEGSKTKYDRALTYFKEALEIKRATKKIDSSEIARSYYHLGRMNQMQSKYDQARSYMDSILDMNLKPNQKNNLMLSNVYHVFGRIYYDQSLADDALASYFKSLDYALKELPSDNTSLDQLNNEIGIVYMDKGNNYEALKYLEKSLSLNLKKYSDRVHPDQVAAHFNIGTAYTNLGIDDKALFHTQKAADLGKTVFGENHPNFHFIYSQLGRLYGAEKGIDYLNRAIGLLEKNRMGRNELIISIYQMFIANIYTQMNEHQKAQEYIKKAQEITLRLLGKQNFRTIETQNGLAKSFVSLNEYDQALIYVDRSLKSNYIDFTNESVLNQDFDISKMIDCRLFIEAIEIKTDINLIRFHKTKDIQFLKESYKLSRSLDDVIAKTRNTLRDPDDKTHFTSLVKDIYGKHAEICMLLYELESIEQYKHEAFRYAEKSKSNVLRELVNSNKIKDQIDIEEGVLILENEINGSLAKARTDMVKEISKSTTDSMKVYAIQEEIIQLFQRKDSLEEQIEFSYPKYFQLKYNQVVFGVKEVQSQLQKDTSLIEFLIADDALFVFIINANSYHVKTIKIDQLPQKIQDFNMSIVNQNYDAYKKNARILYDELFNPVESFIDGKNIVIVPDEALWHLQFDLLLKEENLSSEINNHYLVHDYAFSYVNSATFLLETKNNSSQKNITNECLAFSYSGEEEIDIEANAFSLERLRNSTIDLPGTRQEIKALSNIFDGVYYYGKNANEHNFKTHVPYYKITHLALHAEVDSLQSEQLKIVFSNNDTISNAEDNILYDHELYALKIPSDLVVLSACNTGVGKVNKGEGIMSIGNAFQYAGAKSLLLSRWAISDETTPQIVEQFYKNLKEGMSKGQALQQAKIHYLNTTSQLQSAPFYWGSFYILGDNASIEMDAAPNYFLIAGILLIVLLFLYVLRMRSNKEMNS